MTKISMNKPKLYIDESNVPPPAEPRVGYDNSKPVLYLPNGTPLKRKAGY